MAGLNFGEKATEYSPKHGGEIPVWQSPKYRESKEKAIEIINSGKYGVLASDFWILMNATKTGKMAYTGLIISHNGCLKINDHLESKFDPDSVTVDKDGYKGSLVYSYCNKEQGLYEVGEVSPSNCKNEYPYAMAYKRLFDRVVLKLSRLAYAGIYSDSEADEFAQKLDAAEPEPEDKPKKRTKKKPEEDEPTPTAGEKPGARVPPPEDRPVICERCGKRIPDYWNGDRLVKAAEIQVRSLEMHNRVLCTRCGKAVNQ